MYRMMKHSLKDLDLKKIIEEDHCGREDHKEDLDKHTELIKKEQATEVIVGMLQKMAKKDEKPETSRWTRLHLSSIAAHLFAERTHAQMRRLNDQQTKILKATFKKLEEDSVRNGVRVLVALFSEHPRYKKIWPQFRAIPDSSLMNAIELRRHASVYMGGLGQIIKSMDNQGELAEQLNRIAKAHIKWSIHRYHIEHMLNPLLDMIRETNGGLDPETKEAWSTLFDVIANLIEIYRGVNQKEHSHLIMLQKQQSNC